MSAPSTPSRPRRAANVSPRSNRVSCQYDSTGWVAGSGSFRTSGSNDRLAHHDPVAVARGAEGGDADEERGHADGERRPAL